MKNKRAIFPIVREIIGIIAEDELVRIENEHGGTLDVDACSELATSWDEWEAVKIYMDCNGIVVVVREPENDDDLQE